MIMCVFVVMGKCFIKRGDKEVAEGYTITKNRPYEAVLFIFNFYFKWGAKISAILGFFWKKYWTINLPLPFDYFD